MVAFVGNNVYFTISQLFGNRTTPSFVFPQCHVMISVFPAPQRRHDGVYQIDKATNEHTGDSNFISLLLAGGVLLGVNSMVWHS